MSLNADVFAECPELMDAIKWYGETKMHMGTKQVWGLPTKEREAMYSALNNWERKIEECVAALIAKAKGGAS